MQQKHKITLAAPPGANKERWTSGDVLRMLGVSQRRLGQWETERRLQRGADGEFGAADVLNAWLGLEREIAAERQAGAVRQALQHAGAGVMGGGKSDLTEAQIADLHARTKVNEVKKQREEMQLNLEKGALVVTEHIQEIYKSALVGCRVEVERIPRKIARECFPGDRVKQGELLGRLTKVVNTSLNSAADAFAGAALAAWSRLYGEDAGAGRKGGVRGKKKVSVAKGKGEGK